MDLESRIECALDGLCADPDERSWKNPGWTRQVKCALIRLAHGEGHRAYASEVEGADGPEWLYDLTWLNYSREERVLKRAVVVLESEWSRDEKQVVWDFHKLLLARVDLRVMVFQARNDESCSKVITRLVGLVARHEQSQPGDRYLLSGWRRDSRSFCHHRHVIGPA